MSDPRDDEAAIPDEIVVPIDDAFDLHPFDPKEIRSVVESYLEEAIAAGFREVRLIHGRGIGVQREIVRSLLREHPAVVDFADAPPGRGGWGSTIARLAPSSPDDQAEGPA